MKADPTIIAKLAGHPDVLVAYLSACTDSDAPVSLVQERPTRTRRSPVQTAVPASGGRSRRPAPARASAGAYTVRESWKGQSPSAGHLWDANRLGIDARKLDKFALAVACGTARVKKGEFTAVEVIA